MQIAQDTTVYAQWGGTVLAEPLPALGEVSGEYQVRVDTECSVREGPGIEHMPLGSVAAGDVLPYLSAEYDGWYGVQTPYGAGWISSMYATLVPIEAPGEETWCDVVFMENHGGEELGDPQVVTVKQGQTVNDWLNEVGLGGFDYFVRTWEGHEFLGWNTAPDGSGSAFTGDVPITQDISVYAQWSGTDAADATEEQPGEVPALGDVSNEFRVRVDTECSVRTGPGIEYDAIGSVAAGDVLPFLSVEYDGWYGAQTPYGGGWVSSQYASLVDMEAADATDETDPQEDGDEQDPYVVGDDVNDIHLYADWEDEFGQVPDGYKIRVDTECTLRADTDVMSDAVATVYPGQLLEPVGARDGWYAVEASTGVAWISSRYASLVKVDDLEDADEAGDLEETDALDAAESEYIPDDTYDANVGGDVPVPDDVPITGEVSYDDGTEPEASPWDQEMPLRVTTDCQVRMGPGTNFESVGTVSAGTVLTGIGESPDGAGGNWYSVYYGGGTRWIPASCATPYNGDAGTEAAEDEHYDEPEDPSGSESYDDYDDGYDGYDDDWTDYDYAYDDDYGYDDYDYGDYEDAY